MTSSYSHCSGCGSWVVDCRVGSWVVDREFVGCALWCWVAGGCCGWCDMVLGLAMKRQGWETKMRDERDMVLGLAMKRQGWETKMRDERDMVLGWVCFVVLGCGWLLRMAWYGAGLRVLGSAMERQRWETGTRDERQRRESQIKYYYFFTILATVQFYV